MVGIVGTTTLHTILENQSEQVLHEQLGSLRGWIHFDETGEPYWFVDPSDPEEEAEVSRLQAVFVIADDQGRVDKGSSDPALKRAFRPEHDCLPNWQRWSKRTSQSSRQSPAQTTCRMR